MPDSLQGYTRSYKLVLLKAMLRHMDISGKAPFERVLDEYHRFYLDRVTRGLPPDINPSLVIANVNQFKPQDLWPLIRSFPYKVIHEKGYINLVRSDQNRFFSFPPELCAEMDKADWSKLADIIDHKLRLYFASRVDHRIESRNDLMPTSPYFLHSGDFTIAPYNLTQGGNDGIPWLATSKLDASEQYIVKPDGLQPAANEFIYHHVAKALGMYTQEVKLFRNARKVGVRFAHNTTPYQHEGATLIQIRTHCGFETLRFILKVEASDEQFIDASGQLFKRDNSTSFMLDSYGLDMLSACGTEEQVFAWIDNRLESLAADAFFNVLRDKLTSRFYEMGVNAMYETLQRFISFDIDTLRPALDALDMVYPPALSNYYYAFLLTRQNFCRTIPDLNSI